MFFIILCADVMIPCCYDVIVGGDALDFVNLSISSQVFAIECHVSSYTWQTIVRKAASNVLKSLLVPFIRLILAEFAYP